MFDILIEPLTGHQLRFLDHIRRIDSPSQSRIHPHVNQAPQVFAMTREQSLHGITVALIDKLDRESMQRVHDIAAAVCAPASLAAAYLMLR